MHSVLPSLGSTRGSAFSGVYLRFRSIIERDVLWDPEKIHGLPLEFIPVYAANVIGGGIASGVTVAKIVNAGSVIDKIGIEETTIRKVAPVEVILTLLTGMMLGVMMVI